ncbi:MAG: phytanoyl-CoA dioxygenase family protein, partial [Bdellovibrionales bacterium]|nr:phytanoyl-CoA dioxygenase family protein [Bdellovibrionales bacterium]
MWPFNAVKTNGSSLQWRYPTVDYEEFLFFDAGPANGRHDGTKLSHRSMTLTLNFDSSMSHSSSTNTGAVSALENSEKLQSVLEQLFRHPERCATGESLLSMLRETDEPALNQILGSANPLEILNAIREHRQRIPSEEYLFKRTLGSLGSLLGDEDAALSEQLNTRGIVRIEKALDERELEQLLGDFAAFITRIEQEPEKELDPNGFTKEYFHEEFEMYVTNSPFEHSPTLASVCAKPRLIRILNEYLQGYGCLHQATQIRTLPTKTTGYGSFQWHHDAWGKRINIMILLSDIGEGDQYMTFVEGSHRLYYGYEKFLHSRFTQDEIDARLPGAAIFKAMGKAGDVVMFDSNGLHSGNRTPGRARDAVIANYSRDASYVWNMEIPKEVLSGKSSAELRPLRRLLQANNTPNPLFP